MRGTFAAVGHRVRLLDVDPDLSEGIEPDRASDAARASLVDTFTLLPGSWTDAQRFGPLTSCYLISGFVGHRLRTEPGNSLEILGPGSLLLPTPPAHVTVGESEWRVLCPSWLAVLDTPFQHATAAFPALAWNLSVRGLSRARSLSVQLAAARDPKLPSRLLLLLEHLGGLYGRVGTKGISVNIPLSHEVLAEMVAATRPAVSKAMKSLERAGQLSRSADRGYVLHRTPTPQQLAS